MNELIPAFDFAQVVIAPWAENFAATAWVVLMGALVGTACGIVGNYLLLRRMALVGDAISHSILPGLVLVFLVFRNVSTPLMFLGAIGAGLLTVGIIEFIHRQTRVKADAATCIAFTTLFAIGVVMISVAETGGPLHIDAECVLYGEIAFVPLEPPVVIGGHEIGPPSVIRMAGVTFVLILLVAIFYKELLLTSFDPALARSMGLNTGFWHYALMAALSIVVVSSFEAVGAILAVAMLIVPAMFAAQLTFHLPTRFVLTAIHSVVSSLLGFHLAVWLGCSTAAAMVVVGAVLFLAAWALTSIKRKPRLFEGIDQKDSVFDPAQGLVAKPNPE